MVGEKHVNERRFAGKLERLHSPERLKLLEMDRVLALSLEGLAIQSALDVGTGGGLFAKTFAERGLQVAGVDVNPEMVAAAAQYVPDSEFWQAPAENLPVPDDSYDLVFVGHVLHEVDDVVKTLQEARRAARQRVVILEWPYREQEYGPPLDHRLQHEDMVSYAPQAGFSKIANLTLTPLVLYRLDM